MSSNLRPTQIRRLRATISILAAMVVLGASAGAAMADDLIDVVRFGDGSAACSNAASRVSVVPVSVNGTTATSGNALDLPTAVAGSNKRLTNSCQASSNGQLSVSASGGYLVLAGYDAALGTSAVTATDSATTARVIGRISPDGTINTTTALTNAFPSDNIRAGASNDGSQFWVTGNDRTQSSSSNRTAVRYAALGATTSSRVAGDSDVFSNGTNVGIAGGQLYFANSRGTTGMYKIGSGLPTSDVTSSSSAIANLGTSNPLYGFVFLKVDSGSAGAVDTLYLSDGTAIKKFYSANGTSWTAKGSVTASNTVYGLAGKVVGSDVVLYGTTTDGVNPPTTTIFKKTDSAGASGTITSGAPTTLSTLTSSSKYAYRGVAIAPSNQTWSGPASGTVTVTPAKNPVLGETGSSGYTNSVTLADSAQDPANLAVTATSSNSSVLTNANITISGSGATRTITMVPTGVGRANVTVTAQEPGGGGSGTAVFEIAISAQFGTSSGRFLHGASDASTAQDAGDGYVIVADDESNILRLYNTAVSGPPVKTWDFHTQLSNSGDTELDLEASARVGNTIYWTGSHGNSSSSGDRKTWRETIFATTISGSGAATNLTYTGTRYPNLRNDLVTWDNAHSKVLGLEDSTAPGTPKTIDGFNIEGLEVAPNGTTAYVGFRAPLESPGNRTNALVVPITNFPSLISSGASPVFGNAMLWNLGGLSVREIRRNNDGQYLVLAGSYADGGAQALYIWDGNESHQPVLTPTTIPPRVGGGSNQGSYEGIVSAPTPLVSGSQVRLIQDDGGVIFYGDGTVAKDLSLDERKAYTDVATLQLNSQPVAFTSAAPSSAAVGGATYHPTATGGASGNPVTFSIDISAAAVCSISGGNVSFTAAGTCTVEADQAAAPGFEAGHAEQSFSVAVAAPTVSITSPINGSLKNSPVSATFVLGGGAAASVVCRWDGDAATPCASPVGPRALVAGSHSFSVTVANVTGTATASSSFTVSAPDSTTVGAVAIIVHFPRYCELTGGDSRLAPYARFEITNARLERVLAGSSSFDTWGEMLPDLSAVPDNAGNRTTSACRGMRIRRVVRADDANETDTLKGFLAGVNPSAGWTTTYTGSSWPRTGTTIVPSTPGADAVAATVRSHQNTIGYANLAAARTRSFRKLAESASTFNPGAYAYTDANDVAGFPTTNWKYTFHKTLFWIPLQSTTSPGEWVEPTMTNDAIRLSRKRGSHCPGTPLGDWTTIALGTAIPTSAYPLCAREEASP